jgi:hypothetical protein
MKHHPRYLNSVQRAIESASRLPERDRYGICKIVNDSVDRLRQGGAHGDYSSLVYAFNMAEALSDLGICSDKNSRAVIVGGQIALSILADRCRRLNSWTLRASELTAITEAAFWHCTQLGLCSLGEYLKAKRRVDNFMSAAQSREKK